MILSDRSIRDALRSGRIVIEPLGDQAIQPSSVDLRLDRHFRMFDYVSDSPAYTETPIDVKDPAGDYTQPVSIPEDGFLLLEPMKFVLGTTVEDVRLPDDLVGRLDGKSSLGRLGLLIHSTAGFVDAGWKGQLTLELYNVANRPIRLYAGMKIGQISFVEMSTPAERPYGHAAVGSKYQNQMGPTASRYWENYER